MVKARRKSRSRHDRVKQGHPFLYGIAMQTFVAHWQLSHGCTAAVIEIIPPNHRSKFIRYRARVMVSSSFPLSAEPRQRLDLAVKDLERFVEMMHAAFSGYLAPLWLNG